MTLAGIVDEHMASTRAVLEQAQKALPQAIQQYLNKVAEIPQVTAVYLRVAGFNMQIGVVLADYDVDNVTANSMAISELEATMLNVHPDFCVNSENVYSEGKSLEQLEQEGAIPEALGYDAQVTPPFTRIYTLEPVSR